MSNITEPQTFIDLVNDFIARMKESPTTSKVIEAKRLINNALVNCHRHPGSNFQWPERQGVLITTAPYSTGTVTIDTSTSRTAVAGASTFWTTTVPGFGFLPLNPGGKIIFAGDLENYVVDTIPTASALTLRSSYVGDSISGASYRYFEDEYTLAVDFEDFVDLRFFSTDMEIPLIGRTDFRRATPRNDRPGRPKVATCIQVDFSGSSAPQHRVILHPHPDATYQIPYWYKSNYLAVSATGVRQSRLTLDTDEPVVPIGKRHGITLYAIYEYYRDVKDDLPRAQVAQAEYASYMQRIIGEKPASDAKPRFFVRRHGSGLGRNQRFDWGGRADTLGDFRRWGR